MVKDLEDSQHCHNSRCSEPSHIVREPGFQNQAGRTRQANLRNQISRGEIRKARPHSADATQEGFSVQMVRSQLW